MDSSIIISITPMRICVLVFTTDLKNRTGLSIYFWELKPTAATLNGPPEEYSGVTETKIKTLTFSTES